MFLLKSKRSNKLNAQVFMFFWKITKNWKKSRIWTLIRENYAFIIVSSKIFPPTKFESKIVPPPPFCFPPLKFENLVPPLFVVPLIDLQYSSSPHPKFSTYV